MNEAKIASLYSMRVHESISMVTDSGDSVKITKVASGWIYEWADGARAVVPFPRWLEEERAAKAAAGNGELLGAIARVIAGVVDVADFGDMCIVSKAVVDDYDRLCGCQKGRRSVAGS